MSEIKSQSNTFKSTPKIGVNCVNVLVKSINEPFRYCGKICWRTKRKDITTVRINSLVLIIHVHLTTNPKSQPSKGALLRYKLGEYHMYMRICFLLILFGLTTLSASFLLKAVGVTHTISH